MSYRIEYNNFAGNVEDFGDFEPEEYDQLVKEAELLLLAEDYASVVIKQSSANTVDFTIGFVNSHYDYDLDETVTAVVWNHIDLVNLVDVLRY